MLTVKDLNHPEKDKEAKNHLKLHNRELAIVNVLVKRTINIFYALAQNFTYILNKIEFIN